MNTNEVIFNTKVNADKPLRFNDFVMSSERKHISYEYSELNHHHFHRISWRASISDFILGAVVSEKPSAKKLKDLKWIIFLNLILFSSALFSQNHNIDKWEAKDGLAQNSVKVILQSQDGYLWLSTEGGLSRFDGVNFTNYVLGSNPVLKSNRMGQLFENINGDLLFWNYRAGFLRLRGHELINISDSILGFDKRVKRIITCAKGVLMIESYDLHLSFLKSEDYHPISTFDPQVGDELSTIYSLDQYNIWIYRDSIAVKDHDLKPMKGFPTIIPSEQLSSFIFNKSTQELWTVEGDSLIRYANHQKLSAHFIPPKLLSGKNPILRSNNAQIFLQLAGTSQIYLINQENGDLSIYSDAQEICPTGEIRETLIDREGNVWFATSACGLIKIKPPRISYLDDISWDIKRNFYPIIRDSLDNTYLGGNQSAIIKIDDKKDIRPIPNLHFIGANTVNSIEFHNGNQYFSTYITNHIWKNSNGKLSKIYFPDSLPSQKNAIYSSPSNRLIVGSDSGYYVLKGERFISHPFIEDGSMGFISNFHETEDGILWIASGNQLLAYDEKANAILFDSRVAIPEMKGFREIVEDEEHRMFIGSYGHGFIVIENGKAFQINKEYGLVENVVSTITEDSFGQLWLTGNKGLTRLNKAEVLDLVHGKTQTLNVVLYNEQTDRFRSSEFNGGHQHSKCWIGDDCYIFPTINGAVIVDFEKMQGTQEPPSILIENLMYSDSTYFNNQDISADYSGERLDIHYTSTSFIAPNQIKFKYKLLGYDKDWIDAENERKTSYSKIPPGEYEFQVMACSHEGVWNKTPATLTFTIIPPFYLTNWFRIALILLGIVLTVLVVNTLNRRKSKQIARRQKSQLEAIVDTEEKERKRIAADLHDGVGQLLSRVKINLGLAEDRFDNSSKAESMDLVNQSKLAIEEIMTELRNISYNLLPPSLDQFGLAVAIAEEVSKLKNNPNLHIHFDHSTQDTNFKPKVEIALFRVFQELLNNAIKHADASEITIQLIQHETSLLLMIEDDGKGFEVQKAIRKVDSSGLKNIYSRVQFVNGKMHTDSKLGNGTNTTIEIPL